MMAPSPLSHIRMTMDALPLPSILCDPTLAITYANEAAQHLLDDRPLREAIEGDAADRLKTKLGDALKQGVAFSAQPVTITQGDPQPYDVSIRQVDEEMLEVVFSPTETQDMANIHKQILDHITDACFAINERGHVRYANRACGHITRLTEGELIGARLHRGQVDPHLMTMIDEVREDQQAKMMTLMGPILPAGIARTFEVRCYPMDALTVCIAHDIEAEQITSERLRGQRELESALQHTAAAINSTLDLDRVLSLLLDQLRRVIDYDRATLMLIEGDKARVVRQRGYDGPEVKTVLTSFSMALEKAHTLREMMETRQPLVIDNVEDDPRWLKGIPEDLVSSYVGAPLTLEGEVIGFLNLDSNTVDSFDEEDARRLAMFAEQAATAIQNASLYDQIQQQVHELETRNADLKVFAHAAAHDLRAPLQVIIGMTDLLLSFDQKEVGEDTLIGLKTIAEYGDRMETIIKNLLDLAELRNDVITLEAVGLEQLVKRVTRHYTTLLNVREVEVQEQENYPEVLAHEALLEQVISNYVENAIKYIGKDNPTPRIELIAEENAGRVRFYVNDNGIGVPDDQKALVFDVFTRANRSENKGHGLGLSICKRIIEGMGGTVGVSDSPIGGSAFWFELAAADSQDDDDHATDS